MDILILYSQYSKKCKKFMRKLEGTTVVDVRKFHRLCVDHPSVRQLVTDYPVQCVPCVLVKTSDNLADMEAYEGEQAFEWLDAFVDQVMAQIQEQQERETNERLEREAREALSSIAPPPAPVHQPAVAPTTVKSKAKLIAQNRAGDMTFDEDQKQDAGDAHVSHVRARDEPSSPAPGNLTDLVKRMESERARGDDEIRRAMPPNNQ